MMSWYAPRWLIRVTHKPTGIFAELNSNYHRSQHMARTKALQLLKARVNHPCEELREIACYELPDDEPFPHDLAVYRDTPGLK